jgi:hypothetical protein
MPATLTRRAALFLPLLALGAAGGRMAAAPALAHPVRRLNHADGVALKGQDVMAWHLERRPRRGQAGFHLDWQDVRWHFASAAHRDAFAADPARFAPAYGGFCAFGVAQGYKVDIDPEAWQIVGERLYLNYSRGVHRQWARDIPGHIRTADRNWPRLADA